MHFELLIQSFLQGRPKGVTPKFSLAPLVPRLSELLGIEVKSLSLWESQSLEKALFEG